MDDPALLVEITLIERALVVLIGVTALLVVAEAISFVTNQLNHREVKRRLVDVEGQFRNGGGVHGRINGLELLLREQATRFASFLEHGSGGSHNTNVLNAGGGHVGTGSGPIADAHGAPTRVEG